MAIKDKKSLGNKDLNEISTIDSIESVTEVAAIPAQISSPFQFRLVVRNPFGNYRRGHIVYGAAEIAAVIDGGNLSNCNKIKI